MTTKTMPLPLPLALRILGALETHAPPDARIRLSGDLADLAARVREALRNPDLPPMPTLPRPRSAPEA